MRLGGWKDGWMEVFFVVSLGRGEYRESSRLDVATRFFIYLNI